MMKNNKYVKSGIVIFAIIVGSFILISKPSKAGGPVCPDGRRLCAVDAHGHVYHKGNPIPEE